MRLPDFLGIGPGRSGTTTVYEVLRNHPQVCMARGTKEVNFFNQEYSKGLEWYGRFFDACPALTVAGEISNTYIYSSEAAARIRSALPNVKILATLRHPVDRLVSVFRFRQQVGELPLSLTLDDALASPAEFLAPNHYEQLIQPYLDLFPREQILILLFDDLLDRPTEYFGRLFDFLDVPVVDLSVRQKNASRKPRFRWVPTAVRTASDMLRKLQLQSVLLRAKRSPVVRAILFQNAPEGEASLSKQRRVELARNHAADVRFIEALTGRNLEHWLH